MDATQRQKTLALLLIAAASIIAFGNSFAGRFFLDDNKVIVDNLRLHHVFPQTAAEWLGPRALVDLTFAASYASGGLNPADYHAGNLLIHTLTALLLFGLVRRTVTLAGWRAEHSIDATWLAAVVALTWTVHPLTGTAVMYVCQRYELMAGLFTVLTLYAVARGASSAKPAAWQVLAVAACLAGLASKETVLVTPLLVLAYDRAFLATSCREAWQRRRGLYIGLAASCLYLALPLIPGLAAGVHDYRPEGPSLSYLAGQSRVIAHYLRLTVWPHPLCLDYGWTAQAASFASPLAGGLVALLAVVGMGLAWRRPQAGFIGLWFAILLIPTSSIFPHTDAAFDHRMYLPLAGLAAAWTLMLAALSRRMAASPTARRLAYAIPAGLTVMSLATVTLLRNRDYHDAEHMWSSVLECRPDNVRAAVCLTAELYARHRDADAITAARSTLAQVLPASGTPSDPRRIVDTSQLLNNLGLALLRDSRPTEARTAFEQAVTLAPGNVRAHLNFGAAALASGDTNTAWREVELAWRLTPKDPDALQSMADLLAITGLPRDAAQRYRQALQLRPDSQPLQRRLAWLLATCPDPSVRDGAEALRLAKSLTATDGGRNPETLDTLAAALAESGDRPHAAQLQAQVIAAYGSTPERQTRLESYRTDKPWRDARLTPAPGAAADKGTP